MIKDGKTVSKILWAFAGVILIGMIVLQYGCTKLPDVPAEMIDQYQGCMTKAHSIAIEESKNIPVFKDDRDFIIWRLTANDKIYGEHCDDMIIAFLRENGAAVTSSNRLWGKGIGAGAVIGGIYAGGNAIEGIVGAAGAVSTYNLSGSRAVFANGATLGGSPGGSATVSSSGDGEIYGNTQAIQNDKVLQFPANNAESNNDPGGSNNNNINDAENVSDVDADLGL